MIGDIQIGLLCEFGLNDNQFVFYFINIHCTTCISSTVVNLLLLAKILADDLSYEL